MLDIDLLELVVVHETVEDILVLLHPVDEQALQGPAEDVAQVVEFVGNGRLAQVPIGDRIFTDRIQADFFQFARSVYRQKRGRLKRQINEESSAAQVEERRYTNYGQ